MLIGLIAGEPSGDALGAHLMMSLKAYYPKARFVGIGGPLMIQQGFDSWVPMNELSVMGIVDVIKNFPRLYRILRSVRARFLSEKPNVFIGIDAPDFNLRVEKTLHAAGIKTVHYASPSVWAWRAGRTHKIKNTVNLMLVLFPFERDFYHQYQVPVEYVGHPLADQIPLVSDQYAARLQLSSAFPSIVIETSAPWVAVLPGSRKGELEWMAPVFLETMIKAFKKDPKLRFCVPFADTVCRNIFEKQLELNLLSREFRDALYLFDGNARLVLQSSDIALVASGTATLEALLYKKPMVVGYRWGRLSHAIISPLVKIPFISLPNILAKRMVVPEFVQNECTSDNLVEALFSVMASEKAGFLKELFLMIHKELAQDTKTKVAQAIVRLLEDKKR